MQHLRTRAQFQALLAHRPVARTAHFALHRLPVPAPGTPEATLFGAPAQAWLGAMVPKRWARRAVTRNAIRRQIYAVGADRLAALPGARLVRQHAVFSLAQFPSATSTALKGAVRAELLELLAREPS
ncbi:ribonuclease P protein component [Ottowia sp.]|uniref:ribonuclease P protein component n=1 Tax=Ottowia sp. TaxID=1898956 RepID=UPI002C6EAB0C|nr:ribonuclease P protein component [Ottowia sp.]